MPIIASLLLFGCVSYSGPDNASPLPTLFIDKTLNPENQIPAEKLKEFLPDALNGWTKTNEKASTSSPGAGAGAEYVKGGKKIRVFISNYWQKLSYYYELEKTLKGIRRWA